MNKILDFDDYIDKRVKIINTSKSTYMNKGIVGKCGTVVKTSSGEIGVHIDNEINLSSSYGIFWFDRTNLEILESEDINMTGFNKVAIVNLLDDYNKKDYAFALYDTEMELLKAEDYGLRLNQLVVVNARGKDNRILGIVKEIMPVEQYGKNVTAQVVGVVNMDGYDARVNEEERLKELAKKKAAIEKELEAEINKRKSVEYYEEMAKKYSDNPRLDELVKELKELCE